MQGRISGFVLCVRIGTDLEQCFGEAWRWQLTGWIATDQGRLLVARKM